MSAEPLILSSGGGPTATATAAALPSPSNPAYDEPQYRKTFASYLSTATDVVCCPCCLRYCESCVEVDPDTMEDAQSQSGNKDATAQDFARGRVVYGDGFWRDAGFHLRNNHSLLSIFAHHRNNPFSRFARILTVICGIAFSLFITFYITLLFDTTTCLKTSCGECLASSPETQGLEPCDFSWLVASNHDAFNYSSYNASDPKTWWNSSSNYYNEYDTNYTWLGIPRRACRSLVPCMRNLWFSSTNTKGGCAWYARNPNDAFIADSNDNGCWDPILSRFTNGVHLDTRPAGVPIINQSTDDGWCAFLANLGQPNADPVCISNASSSSSSPSSSSSSSSSNTNSDNWQWSQFSVNKTREAFLINNNQSMCARLPLDVQHSTFITHAHAQTMDIDFDYARNYNMVELFWVLAVIRASAVLVFVKVLSMAAACKCALKGARRRITVCCCRCSGSCCFFMMALVGLVFIGVCMIFISCLPNLLKTLLAFLQSQAMSLLMEVMTCFAYFCTAYLLQRNCRYSRCCARCCGCFGVETPTWYAAGDNDDIGLTPKDNLKEYEPPVSSPSSFSSSSTILSVESPVEGGFSSPISLPSSSSSSTMQSFDESQLELPPSVHHHPSLSDPQCESSLPLPLQL